MRLLNTKTLELTYFVGQTPEYAILSHRWEEEEIIFEDVSKIPLSSPNNPARSKLGFAKVAGTCALAADDGYEWVWIDSCCIDKSSSAELQESINSMFRWYQKAEVCYAYLSDVADESSGWRDAFQTSVWFKRGWTLQELLAPFNVEFYSADWSFIGTKLSRVEEVASTTGIDTEALEFDWGTSEDSFCAAQKLSWAAHRKVSKAEDSSYCLFGLFNVNMPLLYGEGEEKAFQRLQQAIFEETADYTLFLFTWAPFATNAPILAASIDKFCKRFACLKPHPDRKCFPSNIPYSQIVRSGALSHLSAENAHYIRLVRQGVMIKLPLMKYEYPARRSKGIYQSSLSQYFLAILPLFLHGDVMTFFGIVLQKISPAGYIRRCEEPIFLGQDMTELEMDRKTVEAYLVYTSLPKDLVFPFQSVPIKRLEIKTALFAFRSQSFKALDWSCQTLHETLIETEAAARFPMPQRQDPPFILTMCFQSVVNQDLVGSVSLWYSLKNIGLDEISLSQGDCCLARWIMEPELQPPCVRIIVPIGTAGDSLRIAIRRISVPKYQRESLMGAESLGHRNAGPVHRIEAGYCLHVTHVPGEPQPSIQDSEPSEQVMAQEEWVL